MVSLPDVLKSNSQIPSSLPKQPIAVFAGATSGIGEATLKAFVKHAIQPRIYLLARNPASAARIIAECRQLNSKGEYVFIKADLSLVKDTDQACTEVKKKEKLVNLVVLSAGEISFDRGLTTEGLHSFMAASTYTRMRITQQLLPLLANAAKTTNLARVLNVAGGTKEGEVDVSDLAALRMSLFRLRPHLTSIHTLALESLAEQAPTVSFVHEFPGPVYTNLHKGIPGWMGWLTRTIHDIAHALIGRWLYIPIEECAERHVYLATSARYKPKHGNATGVEFPAGVKGVKGSDGIEGSGVYSLDWDCEGPGQRTVDVLNGLRNKGVKEIVWNHMTEEFKRISGNSGNNNN